MVEINDKRKRVDVAPEQPDAVAVPEEPTEPHAADGVEAAPLDYLDDLMRVTAEFANYRKREQDRAGKERLRITAGLLGGLLPVLDNFERALEHGPVDSGIQLVYKQLQEALAQGGLEEVPAEGKPFDPALHEAVESVEDAEVMHEVCKTVYRRGYRVGDHLIRPAMVVVARPADEPGADEPSAQEPAQEAG